MRSGEADLSPDLALQLLALLARGTLVAGTPYGKPELMRVLAAACPSLAPFASDLIDRWVAAGVPPPGLLLSAVGRRQAPHYVLHPGPGSAPAAVGRAASHPRPLEARPGRITIYQGDNLNVLAGLPSESVDLIYIDPPFNTGKVQRRTQLSTERDEHGDRTGFKGYRYKTVAMGTKAYGDAFDDYLGFLVPRLEETFRLLKPAGSLFLHLDYREVHYAKVALDGIFGRVSFINEIVWAYDYGARSKIKWACKHDNILWYAKNHQKYCFNYDEMDRIPYMAPDLVGEEKAARGKTPTDTWWHTIVSPNGSEKTGYPTQKPLGILNRIIKVHSRPGDLVLDFFAGSGTLGESAALHGRDAILVDNNPDAIAVMMSRLARFSPTLNAVGDQLPPGTSGSNG